MRPLCALVLAGAVAISGCDKAPLLAPGGTVIFLNATSPSVSATGTVEIIAVLLEQGTTSSGSGTGSSSTPAAGTPVHNGTLVSFATDIGRIEPAEARTENGQVKVRFIGDGRSGAAKILAYSGGARAEMTLNVGAAAAERLLVTATPVGSTGGTSTVSAKVEDASGNPLSGVVVQFSTTRGTLSATSATTDAAGIATVTLTTTTEAVVTASAGSKSATATITPATRSGLTITAPTTVTASAPATFTFNVSSGANVQNLRVDWGDGEVQDLGAIFSSQSHQHTYGDSGPYTVRAVPQMADGTTEPAATAAVTAGAFTVGISSSNPNPSPNNVVTFTATVTPNTVLVEEYFWDFGDGTTRTTDGPATSHTYTAASSGQTRTVTVTVIPVKGRSRSNSTQVRVS